MDIAHKESDKILEELEKELKKLYSSCYKKNTTKWIIRGNGKIRNYHKTISRGN